MSDFPTALEEYEADFNDRRVERGLSEDTGAHVWQQAETYRKARDKPTAMPFGPVALERQTKLQDQRNDFVRELDAVVEQYGEEIPFQMLMQYDVDELRAFRADDLGLDLEALSAAQYGSAFQVETDTAIRQEAEKRFQDQARNHRFWEVFAGVSTAGIGLPAYELLSGDGISLEEHETQVRSEWSKSRDGIYEEDIAKWRANREKELTASPSLLGSIRSPVEDSRSAKGITKKFDSIEERLDAEEKQLRLQIIGGADPGDLLNTRSGLHNVAAGTMGGMAWGFDKLLTGFAGTMDILQSGGPPGDTTFNEYLHNRAQSRFDETNAAIEAAEDVPEGRYHELIKNATLEEAWKNLPETNPDDYNELLEMADGNVTVAAGFFWAGASEFIESSEQFASFVKDVEAADTQMVTQMMEQDFRTSHEIMDLISMWGRNGPGRFSTVFTLLLTDEDYMSELVSGQFSKVWNEVGEESSALGHTPSAVIGIDGSLVGLIMDLSMGIAFDPTTYFLGPKFLGSFKGASGPAKAAQDAAIIARSAPVRAMGSNVFTFVQSTERGAAAVYHVSSWMSDVGLSRMLELIGFESKVLPRADWVRHSTGHRAQLMSVEKVLSLVPEETLARIADSSFDAASLGDDILANGYKEAGRITISRADETAHLADGVKRALAAQEKGIKQIPMSLEVLDDASHAVVAIPGNTLDEAAHIAQIADPAFERAVMPGGSPMARTGVLNAAKTELASGGALPFGQVTNKRGVFELFRKTGTQGGDDWVQYMAVGPDGEVVASVLGNRGKSLGEGMGLTMGSTEGKIMEQIWDLARAKGDDFILQSGVSPSLSEDGARFTQMYAAKLMEESTGQLSTTGAALDDVLADGAGSLKKPLRSIDDGSGRQVHRPDQVFPSEFVHGRAIPEEEIAKIIEDDILLYGAKPSDGARSVAMASFAGRAREIIRKGTPEEIRSMMTKASTSTRIDTHGAGHMRRIMDNTVRLWGDNQEMADIWMQKFMEYQTRARRAILDNNARLAHLEPLRMQLQGTLDALGGSFDDAFRLTDDLIDPTELLTGTDDLGQQAQAVANRAQYQTAQGELRETLGSQWKYLEEETIKAMKGAESMTDQTELVGIVEAMWEDFNRTAIVPRWKKVIKKNPHIFDDELGIIRWEYLQKGQVDLSDVGTKPQPRKYLPESLAEQAKAAKIADPEKLYRFLNSIPDTPMTAEVPMSVLDMIAASTATGKRWIQYTQTAGGHIVREATFAMHKMWVFDKVLRPATAMTVSGDELLRMFHTGGREAVGRYMGDRALFLQARINQLLHGGEGSGRFSPSLTKPLRRDAVRRGSGYSERVVERLRKLDEYSLRTREWERIFYDDAGNGWQDIQPGSTDYLDAAKRWSGQQLQQSGFRAFLRGEDDFIEWFMTNVDADGMRNATIMKATEGGPQAGYAAEAAEAYRGMQTMFDNVTMSVSKADGTYNEVRAAWVETARRIDASGGSAVDLPDFVFEHLGAVRGQARHVKRKARSPLRMTDAFFDRFFLDPVNYRRGFVAEMVATVEAARLEGLFLSQGKRIVSDMEVADALGYKGLSGATRTGVSEAMAEQAIAKGMVPQSHIDRLIQYAVDSEIEHMLYIADEGRRIGQVATGTLFPFGKPYADMMGFWAREMFRRPHWRGLINEENAGVMGKVVTAGGNFNPRTPALISRLAHTDFNIDQGWTGMGEGESAGLLPGSENTDLSPLLFLPTAGESPFYSMLPGLGYIPMWGLDMIMAAIKDPSEDPLGYQRLVDNIGDVIGGAHFGNPDPLLSGVQRVLGGGTIGQTIEGALDVYTLFGDASSFGEVPTMLGQVDRDIDRGRMMSALFSDPEEWTELLALDSDEAISLYLDAMALEADQKAAGGNLAEVFTRFLVAANSKFSGELDQIYDVWVDAGDMFPSLAGQGRYDDEVASPEERQKYADDVRGAFFDLSQSERDRMITEYPPLAVNLVSSWDWTDSAHDARVDGTNLPYRTDGSREGLARHDIFIKEGYIRALSPQERARRFIGLYFNAKRSTSHSLYETVTAGINDQVWENLVKPETKEAIDAFYADAPELWDAVDIRSGRELWEAWGRYEEDFEEFAANALDIAIERGPSTRVADQTSYDKLRSFIKIPEKEKSWGTSWPGTDVDSLAKRWSNVTLDANDFTEDVRNLAKAIEVDLTVGMTVEQLYNGVQSVDVDLRTPVAAHVGPAYKSYIGERSAASREVDEHMRSIANNTRYSENWRQGVSEFLDFSESIQERYRGATLGIPAEEQLEVQSRYMALMNTANDTVVTDWQQLWDMRYERTYGPLGWEPPEPLSPFHDDGSLINGAYQPFIQSLIDGDSIVVTSRNGDMQPHEVRLLGVRARDYGLDDEGAKDDKYRLWDRLQQAIVDGDRIYLVRQAETFGNVDIYGRELAWLWIGDEPFYFAEEMLPTRDPSGGDS